MRTTRSVLPVVLLLAAAAACSGSDDDNPSLEAPSPTVPVPTSVASGGGAPEIQAVKRNRFVPDALTIKEGQSVRVFDTDPDAPHNFVVNGVGRSPTLEQGDTFSLQFKKAGTYRFVCTFHEARGMVGTITVTAS
jgi:plastocyanin